MHDETARRNDKAYMCGLSDWSVPVSNLPTSTSFVNGPYTSDVSSNVTPRSMALCMTAVLSSSEPLKVGSVYEQDIPIQPKPCMLAANPCWPIALTVVFADMVR